MRVFIHLSELHKLIDFFVIQRAVLSVVLTDEVLWGQTDRWSHEDKSGLISQQTAEDQTALLVAAFF